MRTYEVADLFCGAGGTSTGAVRALVASAVSRDAGAARRLLEVA